jgi:hypothetical protein
MWNQPHHLPRWIVLPLPLTPRWLAPIHSDAEPLSGRQQVADAGGSASPTVHSASNRETCLASQRSRPAGVRTPRASSSWAIAASASVNEPGTRKALPSSPLGPSPPPLSVSGWENATTSLQDARAVNLPHMAERYHRRQPARYHSRASIASPSMIEAGSVVLRRFWAELTAPEPELFE